MTRRDGARLGLTVRLHETARGLVGGVVNGVLMGYPPARLRQLVDEAHAALGTARLPQPWDDALHRLRAALESDTPLDAGYLAQLLQTAGLGAGALVELMGDNTHSPEVSPQRAREYARLVWASELRALASRIYSAAGSAELDTLEKLIAGELPALLERDAETRPSTLRPRTAQALLETTPVDHAWLWYGVIPARGFTLLAAREKAGKSTLLLGLVSALEAGAFLGRQTTPARVLYLSEESAATVADKLRRFGLANDTVYFLTRDDFNGGTVGALHRHRAAIERAVRELGIQFVVIDTLQGFARIVGDAENHAGAMLSEILVPVQRLLSLGVGVLVVHHMAKHTHEPRGSTALGGAPDVIVRMRSVSEESDDTRRELRWVGRLGDGVLLYRYERDTGAFEPLGEPDEAQFRDTARRILHYLETAGEPQPLDAICTAVGGARQRVAEAVHQLYRANALTRTGSGRRGDPYLYALAVGNAGLEIDPALRTPFHGSISNPSAAQQVREWLQQHGAGTAAQAADALGLTRRRASQLLNELVAQGLAERQGTESSGYTYHWAALEIDPRSGDLRPESISNPPAAQALEIDPRSGDLRPESISNADFQPPSDPLYPDDESVTRAFEQWVAQMRGDGLWQLDADDERLVRAVFERARAQGFPALQVRFRNGGWRNLDATRWSWLHAIQTLALDSAALEDLLNGLDGAGATRRANSTLP